MKKKLTLILLVALSLMMGSGPAAAESSMKKIIEEETGKIESTVKPDADKGNFGSFTVTTSGGKKVDFHLLARTRIFGPDSGPLAFDKLAKGDKVTVLYVVTLKGDNTAVSVTQIK